MINKDIYIEVNLLFIHKKAKKLALCPFRHELVDFICFSLSVKYGSTYQDVIHNVRILNVDQICLEVLTLMANQVQK